MTATEYGNRQRLEDELAGLADTPADLPSAAGLLGLWVAAVEALAEWADYAASLAFLAEHHEFIPAEPVERAEALYAVLATFAEQLAEMVRMHTRTGSAAVYGPVERIVDELVGLDALRRGVRYGQVERAARV